MHPILSKEFIRAFEHDTQERVGKPRVPVRPAASAGSGGHDEAASCARSAPGGADGAGPGGRAGAGGGATPAGSVAPARAAVALTSASIGVC